MDNTDKPKIIVYTETKDPRVTSSVSLRKNRAVRQKQEPLRATSPKGRAKIYLSPCVDHGHAVTVSAEIIYFSPSTRKYVSMGVARICFFCRQILTTPSNGWYDIPADEMTKLEEIKLKNQSRAGQNKPPRNYKNRVRFTDTDMKLLGEDDQEDTHLVNPPVSVDVDDGDWLE